MPRRKAADRRVDLTTEAVLLIRQTETQLRELHMDWGDAHEIPIADAVQELHDWLGAHQAPPRIFRLLEALEKTLPGDYRRRMRDIADALLRFQIHHGMREIGTPDVVLGKPADDEPDTS